MSIINTLIYIIWDPSYEAFSLGPLSVRWYSLCWLIGLVAGYLFVQRFYKDEKIASEKFEPLFLYCFLGILAGARLGHCLFYQPEYFLTSGKHFIEMIIPIHFLADGGWKFTGYEGLASHGGGIGLITAVYLYCRKYRMPILQVFDMIAIATPLTGCMIRLGNLMNSEIIGKITDVPWAFIFERVDQMPRHPGQLYEAIAYMCFFIIGLCIYKARKIRVGQGFYLGFTMCSIFVFRFLIEYTKDIQVDFESGMFFNMGQLLSIPYILIGAFFMYRSQHLNLPKQ